MQDGPVADTPLSKVEKVVRGSEEWFRAELARLADAARELGVRLHMAPSEDGHHMGVLMPDPPEVAAVEPEPVAEPAVQEVASEVAPADTPVEAPDAPAENAPV